MKRKTLTLIFMFVAMTTFAQTVATISGHVLNLANSSPLQSRQVFILADSTMNSNGFYHSNHVYTDTNGYYIDSIPLDDGMGGYFDQGTLQVGTFDCNSVFTQSFLSFSSGEFDMQADFNVCVSAPSTSTCTANFYSSAETSDSLTITFYDYSSSSDTVATWYWDFGDGTNSSMTNPVHTYSVYGRYSVCLTITSITGCSNTYCILTDINTFGEDN